MEQYNNYFSNNKNFAENFIKDFTNFSFGFENAFVSYCGCEWYVHQAIISLEIKEDEWAFLTYNSPYLSSLDSILKSKPLKLIIIDYQDFIKSTEDFITRYEEIANIFITNKKNLLVLVRDRLVSILEGLQVRRININDLTEEQINDLIDQNKEKMISILGKKNEISRNFKISLKWSNAKSQKYGSFTRYF